MAVPTSELSQWDFGLVWKVGKRRHNWLSDDTPPPLEHCLSVIFSLHFCICLYICVLYAFVPHLVNQHIDNLFSLWAASIDKHIASLAARHCAFFS